MIDTVTPSSVVPDHIERGHVFVQDHAPMRAERYVLNGSYRPHDHQFVEIAVISGGTGTHRTLYGEQALQRGTAIVLRPGMWHAYISCDALVVCNCYVGEEVMLRELNWAYNDVLLGRLFRNLPLSLDHEGVPVVAVETPRLAPCLAHFERLVSLSAHDAPPERAELLGHLLLFLTPIAHAVGAHDPTLTCKSVSAAVLHCIHLIERDPARSWSLNDFAAAVGLNPSHFSRLFTRSTGLPPMAYLVRWRLERAAAMLIQSDRPIHDIGAEVGWLDANLFARRFRAHFGESASAYRIRFSVQLEDAQLSTQRARDL